MHNIFKIVLLSVLFCVSALSQAMTFKIITGEKSMLLKAKYNSQHPFIEASGEITKKSPEIFRNFIQKHKIKKGNILLSSPGGLVDSSIEIGEEIRKHGFNTIIYDSECASACTYVFAGGVERYMNSNAKLGFHQTYTHDGSMTEEETQKTIAEEMAYLKKMGIDTGILIHAGLTPPEQIKWLTAVELTESNFVTVKDNLNTTAELKLHHETKQPFLEIKAYTGIVNPTGFFLECQGKQLVLSGSVYPKNKKIIYTPTHFIVLTDSEKNKKTRLIKTGACNSECIAHIANATVLKSTVYLSENESLKLLQSKYLATFFVDINNFDENTRELIDKTDSSLTDDQKQTIIYTKAQMLKMGGAVDISSPDIRTKIQELINSCK